MAGFTVWKWELQITDMQVLKLPVQHQVLSVGRDPALPQVPGGKLAIWALVRRPDIDGWQGDARHYTEVRIRIFGTGAALPTEGDMTHLGTVESEAAIWHVFRDHADEPPISAVSIGDEVHQLGGPPMATKEAV